jgi:hypothetical protein
VGAFAEHSTDIHTLVDGLAEEAIPRTSHHYLYLVDPSKVKVRGQQKHCCTQLSALQPGTHSQRS